MRQRLQARADFMGELRMQTKEMSVNAEDRREQLCVKIRTLTVARKTVGTAQSKLQLLNFACKMEKWLRLFIHAPDKLQSGESGHDRLKNLERMLRMRQQYMLSQVAHLYLVKPLNEQSSVDKSGLNSSIIRTGDAEAMSPNGSQNGHTPLAILGLQLSKLSIKKTSYFNDKTEIQKSATLLRYVEHILAFPHKKKTTRRQVVPLLQ